MKLAYSAASPYVRKVNACAIARGIDDSPVNSSSAGSVVPTFQRSSSIRCPKCRR